MPSIPIKDFLPYAKDPCTGTGSFLKLDWEEINSIATCDALLNHAYIVQVDDNKRYVRDYKAGELNELSTPRDKIHELQQAVRKGWTVKVENVEHFSAFFLTKAATMFPGFRASFHLYIGQKGGASFGMHTDPDPVMVVCLQGCKTFHLEGYDTITLGVGDWLYIPANYPHEAFSDDKSAILSVGVHRWGEKTPSYWLD